MLEQNIENDLYAIFQDGNEKFSDEDLLKIFENIIAKEQVIKILISITFWHFSSSFSTQQLIVITKYLELQLLSSIQKN